MEFLSCVQLNFAATNGAHDLRGRMLAVFNVRRNMAHGSACEMWRSVSVSPCWVIGGGDAVNVQATAPANRRLNELPVALGEC